jgi:membrane fusion protein, multidrug efflux system
LSESQSGQEPAGRSRRAPPPRSRPLWRTVLWIAAAIVIAGVIAFLLTPHAQTPAGHAGGRAGAAGGFGGSSRRPSTVVGVATATLGDIPIQVTALGAVTSEANVTVQSQISGTLTNVYFQEGQTVRQGQLLALVDVRPYEVALEQAQGQLLRDQAALDEARLDLTRYQTLLAQDSIARQTVDVQAATVKQDQGVVKSDQAQVASARLNIAYCHIKAPVAGRIGLRQVDPGNYITSNEPNGLVTVNQLDPITVIFALPEDDIPQVATRMAAVGALPATAYDRTGATVLAQGLLYTLDNQIDPTTGTVKGRARFANPNGTMFPDQFVNVTVLVDTLSNAIIVPAVAIRHGPQGDFVYVIQPDSTVKVTSVKVGPAQGEQASIASGLNVGDQVVTDGGDRLTDGARVIQPKDAARYAAMAAKAARQKPAGILGWLEGLFGHKPAPDQTAAGGADQSAAGGPQSGAASSGHGGAGRMQALLATLDLTADQQAKVKAIFADARTKAEAAGDDPDARRAIMQDAAKQVEAILDPAQKAKFEAGRAQAPGGQRPAPAAESAAPEAAVAPVSSAPPARSAPAGVPVAAESAQPAAASGGRSGRMIEALNLDPAQKAQAEAIFAQARAQAQGSSDPDARRAAMREAMTKLDAILRPDQKAKLAAMRAQAGAGRSGGNE